jgi:ABC-type multidrug transport system fused ATPase/permease subunit
MKTTRPIIELLRRLWHHISPRRRRQFGLLLVLTIVASFFEVLSIGAVLPFLAVLTAPNRVFEHPASQQLIHAVGIQSAEQLLLPITVVFTMAAILAGIIRLLMTWASSRLSFMAGADLSVSVYLRTLYQSYEIHIARNSSEVIDGVYYKAVTVIFNVILPSLTIISSIVMMSMIMIALLAINPLIAFATFAGFGSIYLIIIRFTRKKLLLDSILVSAESARVIKSLQEGLGGIRDVLIDGTQPVFCKIFQDAEFSMRRAQANSNFIGQSPRFGMEALGMALIAWLAYPLAQSSNGILTAVPVLGALALGAQRMLPVFQSAYASWVSIQGGRAHLQDILAILDQPLPDYVNQPNRKPLIFKDKIRIKKLSFRYNSEMPLVLKDVDLSIACGSRVGFIGKTGCGKSTLLDLVMGLLQPTCGAIEIDGQVVTLTNHRAWQAHIAHVPQMVFLADTTIEENIAFGVPKNQIDHERVRHAANQAQLADTIEAWPLGYETCIGERGIKLSGGQRQRIGIARALYKEADVIIFDEATSALDNETELAVMNAIETLSEKITILIIAHRLTTLKNCSQIVELSAGTIKSIGSYQDVINKKSGN